MSENKHTPEPWQVFEDDPRAIVTKENPMLSLLSVGEDGLAIMYEEADARRIVACVNACAGISTGHLEKYGLPDFAQKISDLVQQSDELLAAFENGRRFIDLISPFEGDVTRQIDKAIASVKGGAA